MMTSRKGTLSSKGCFNQPTHLGEVIEYSQVHEQLVHPLLEHTHLCHAYVEGLVGVGWVYEAIMSRPKHAVASHFNIQQKPEYRD